MLPLLFLAGAAALAVIVIALLKWDKIKAFVRNAIRNIKLKLGLRVGLDNKDKTEAAGEIKKMLASGDVPQVNMNLFNEIERTPVVTATIHTITDKGKHETVYGVFSKAGEVIEAERVQSKEIDETIQNLHSRSEIVLHV